MSDTDASSEMDLASSKAAAMIGKAAAILQPRLKFQHSVINFSSFTLTLPPPPYYITALKWFHPYSSSYRESASEQDSEQKKTKELAPPCRSDLNTDPTPRTLGTAASDKLQREPTTEMGHLGTALIVFYRLR